MVAVAVISDNDLPLSENGLYHLYFLFGLPHDEQVLKPDLLGEPQPLHSSEAPSFLASS